MFVIKAEKRCMDSQTDFYPGGCPYYYLLNYYISLS